MKNNIIIYLLGVILIASSCSDEFLEVVPPSQLSEEEVFGDISRATNFLNSAYAGVRNVPNIGLDSYTDNSVTYDGSKVQAVSGSTAESCPISSEWSNAMSRIIHINEYLKMVYPEDGSFNLPFDAYDKTISDGLKKRMRGEAYGLRAYFKWLLLKNFAGPSANDPSVMLGYPMIGDKILTVDEANTVARSTYMECYNDIMTDIDTADNYIDFLRYSGTDKVYGEMNTSRISGEMLWALKARMALYASSEAYNQITDAEAANIIYDAIVAIDGGVLIALQAYGDYNNTKNPDHLWRRSFYKNGNLEKAHLPPILFGSGQCNPSQNLIDAFPDMVGNPITEAGTYYEADDPYASRDPRFEKFVFHNGQNDFKSVYIETFAGGLDAVGGLRKRATRTGYYMKKYLSSNISFNPDIAGNSDDNKMHPIYTRAALYLDFAEAAVAAYGTAGKGASMTFSAIDALTIIRNRGGLALDSYLSTASSDLSKLTELIQNERRLENCFTGERYYDVRRWKLPLSELNQPVMGMKITKTGFEQYTYEKVEVEKRRFIERMYYNPIPRAEILKSDALIQNAGWE